MSKVLKSSGEFIPENLIPERIEEPAVWGNFARKVEVYQQQAEALTSTVEEPSPLSAEENEKFEPETQDFNSDFTAPQPQAPPQAAPPPPVEERQPEIDLDALAEEHYNRGVQAGIERMESDYGSSIKTLVSACEHLNTVRDTILKNSIDEIKDLVLIIAEKIIRYSLADQQETIVRTVEDSIQHAVKSDEFVISVNPADLDIIKSKSTDFINSISGLENIIVKSDANIEQGGCIVESSNCTVDATIASQLEIISENLKRK